MSDDQDGASTALDAVTQLRIEQTNVAVLKDRVQALTQDLVALQQNTADFGSVLQDALDARNGFQRDTEEQRVRCESLDAELQQTLTRAQTAEEALNALQNSRLVRFTVSAIRLHGRVMRIIRRG